MHAACLPKVICLLLHCHLCSCSSLIAAVTVIGNYCTLIGNVYYSTERLMHHAVARTVPKRFLLPTARCSRGFATFSNTHIAPFLRETEKTAEIQTHTYISISTGGHTIRVLEQHGSPPQRCKVVTYGRTDGRTDLWNYITASPIGDGK